MKAFNTTYLQGNTDTDIDFWIINPVENVGISGRVTMSNQRRFTFRVSVVASIHLPPVSIIRRHIVTETEDTTLGNIRRDRDVDVTREIVNRVTQMIITRVARGSTNRGFESIEIIPRSNFLS